MLKSNQAATSSGTSCDAATSRATATITRMARNDQKAASALSLDLASKIVTVLVCGIEDLLEVVETP